MTGGTIFDIKEMAVHDGPGIRTTVFFKGCPLRCLWCHNPEGLSPKPQLMYKENRCLHCHLCERPCTHSDCQPYGRCIHACPENLLSICGRSVTAKELSEEGIKSAEALGDLFGGFTFSGGEPLAQPDFLIELCERLKHYHLCIETSGYAEPEVFKKIIEKMDFVIMDIKIADSRLHQKYTGVGNEKILQNFDMLRRSGKECLIRTPLIPGLTDTQENLAAVKERIGGSPWECLPYNTMTGAKYRMLGLEYRLEQKRAQ